MTRVVAGQPAPGGFVDVGGRELHVRRAGRHTDRPVVVVEAGDANPAQSWYPVQDALAGRPDVPRVLVYDRAGPGWSDPGPRPRTADRIVADLDALTTALAPDGQLVLVGHSAGAPHAIRFARERPGRVAGLVLVDPLHPATFARAAAEFGRVRLAAEVVRASAGAYVPARLVRALYRRGIAIDRRHVGAVDRVARDRAHALLAAPSVRRARPAENRAFRTVPAGLDPLPDLGALPVVVLSAAAGAPLFGTDRRRRARMQELWERLHHELTALSVRAEHRVVPGGHLLHLDRPDAVVEAVLAVLDTGPVEAAS